MDWDDTATTWNEREDVRAYAAAAYESLQEQCEAISFTLDGTRACDFGCGTGLLSESLASQCSVVVAVDRSEQMISKLRAKVASRGLDPIIPIAAEVTPAFVADSPHFRAPFDLVTCSSVCAFLDDYPGTVKLLAQCIRPGGLFVQWDWELDASDKEGFGLTRVAIRDALTRAGMELVFVDTGFSIQHGETTMSPVMGVGRKARA